MRKIFCYRMRCKIPAKWTIPGRPVVHLCTKHMRELFPDKRINVLEVIRLPAIGPTEEKTDGNTRASN